MKTKKELNTIRNEHEAPGRKLAELSEEELKHVTGGYTTVEDEDILKEMKLPEFNLN